MVCTTFTLCVVTLTSKTSNFLSNGVVAPVGLLPFGIVYSTFGTSPLFAAATSSTLQRLITCRNDDGTIPKRSVSTESILQDIGPTWYNHWFNKNNFHKLVNRYVNWRENLKKMWYKLSQSKSTSEQHFNEIYLVHGLIIFSRLLTKWKAF